MGDLLRSDAGKQEATSPEQPVGAGQVIRCQAPLVSVSAPDVMCGLNTHQALGVRRATLSYLLDGKAALTPEMALRIEKAFGLKLEQLLRMQLAYEVAQLRTHEADIKVSRYAPA